MKVEITVGDNMELLAAKIIDNIAELMDIQDKDLKKLNLAVIEVCINAFEHGASDEGTILLTYDFSPTRITVKVKDFGKGFDISEIETPDIKKKLFEDDRTRGWGLSMLDKLVDNVDIESTKNGTTITLTKNF